jgi:hypothetical protein
MVTAKEQIAWNRSAVWGFAALGVGLMVLLVILDALAPGGRGFLVVTPKNVDSICYFSTAHSLLFDRDFDLTNQFAVMIPEDSPLQPGAMRWVAVVQKTGRPGSPYAIGYPILGIPFLAGGAAIDALTGGRGDGYGKWAERLFASANVAYLTLGLLALHHWLVFLGRRWNVRERSVEGWAAVAAVALLPGTALGYYAFTVMSHTTSFMSVALFLLVWWTRRDSLEPRDWLWVGATAGLMTLCRWQNALFLIMVAIWDLSEPGRLKKPAWWTSRAAGAAVCITLLIPQFVQWQTIYGTWLTVPQGPQFVSWPPTKIAHVLFSSHNGFFFTTPAVIAGVAGLLWGLRREPKLVGVLLTAMAAQVAVVGSLPGNWSGRAFAMRLLINTLPLVAAGWLYILLRGRRRWVIALLAWIIVGSAFTMLAAVQWRYAFVPRHEPLTFEEAFTDKLKLQVAFQRNRAMQVARNSADLEAVRDRFGESAMLITRLKQAYDIEGRAKESAEAASWLEKRQLRRLF